MDQFEKLAEDNARISKALMQSVFELACDLAGLGPFPERVAHARNAAPVQQRLLGIQQQIAQLRSDLQSLRSPVDAVTDGQDILRDFFDQRDGLARTHARGRRANKARGQESHVPFELLWPRGGLKFYKARERNHRTVRGADMHSASGGSVHTIGRLRLDKYAVCATR